MSGIAGIDVGGRWWGCVRLVGGAWAEGGVLDAQELGEVVLLAGLRRFCARADVVAIERPGGVAPGIARARPAAASQASEEIARAAWLGGELAGRCAQDGQRVHAFPASEWRTHFFGRASVDDAAVEALARLKVTGWPAVVQGQGVAYGKRRALLAQHRPHLADAAGVALYTGTVPR